MPAPASLTPSRKTVLRSLGRLLLWPIRPLLDGAELRRLRRKMPNAHRSWVTGQHGIRPEKDSEYLVRLRRLAAERSGR
jgi:hypothetical protein